MRSMKIVGLLLLVSLLSIAALASPALGADEITAIRSFNTSTITSGETVRVTVDITTSTLVDAPALDEDIPAGWTLTEVNSAGWAYNAVNNDWVGLGGLTSGSAVTIVYDLTPASGDIGTYSVAGTVSGAYDVALNPPEGYPTSSTVAGETDITIESNSIHVYDGEDLLAVINAAMDGDTIYVHEGYYDCGEMIYLEGKSFSIIGDGPELVSINSMLGMILLDEDGQFTFENITLLHMEDYGFSIQATQTYLNNCVAGDVSTNNISMENCNITNRVSVDAGVVRNNVIHEIDANIVEPDVGVPSKTLVIENNTITATCTGPYKAGECRLSNSDAGSSLIFRNNILPNSPVLNLGRYVEVTGNTFIGGSPAIFIEDGPNAAPTLIYENTFDSCTEAILIDDSSIGTIYLNNFLNVGEVCTHAGLNAASPSVWESPAMDYTFRGVSYNGPLGNYYDDYTGADSGNGIGDTPVSYGDLGTDTYPLMGAWDAATATIDYTAAPVDEITATRSFDINDIMAGDTVRVTVDITAGPDKLVESLILDEDIPAGWTVTEVDSAGWSYVPAENQWTTGELSAGSTATIVYDLTADAGSNTDTYSVTGDVSGKIDVALPDPGTDVSFAVGGQTDISVTRDTEHHVYADDDLAAVLDAAFDGDTIYVHAGTYDIGEAGYCVKSLSIIGDSPDTVTIQTYDGMWLEGTGSVLENMTFIVTGESMGDGVLTDGRVTNCVSSYLWCGSNCIVEDCTVTGMIYIDTGIVRNNVMSGIDQATAESYPGQSLIIEGNEIGSDVIALGGKHPLIFRNNVVNGGTCDVTDPVEITDNTFVGGNPALYVSAVSTNPLVTGNTFESCPVAFEFGDDDFANVYLNNFINVATVAADAVNGAAASVWQSPAMDYTYHGVSYNGPLGNYYNDYTGEDGDLDGIGDTPVSYDGDMGTDSYPLMGTWDAATDTIINDAPDLFFVPGNASVIDGQETEIQIMASAFPDGLSGYNLTVVIDDPTVAEIVDIEYPAWATLNESSSMPGTSIYLRVLDGDNIVQAGAEDVVLATLTVSGKEFGSTGLTIRLSDEGMDDDSGNSINALFSAGTLEVTMRPIPGKTLSAGDLNSDGLYEDLTGDGTFSFVDVEVFFNNKEWIEANHPVECSDFNGNSRIDFDDVVKLFEMV